MLNVCRAARHRLAIGGFVREDEAVASHGHCERRHIMKHWLILMGIVGGTLAPEVAASPYWVAWEGNDFPENEGWERIVNGVGPAERTLSNGIMTMDGLADQQIDDYYRMERPIDPGQGEEFVMQWRLRVRKVVNSPLALFDPGLEVFSDDDWSLAFVLGTDFIRSFHESIEIPFQAGLFHTFEVRTSDMRAYELLIDDSVVHVGSFWEPTFRSSRIEWGDYTRGSASLVDWDYFRFGVVPEPETGIATLALLCIGFGHSRRRIQ